MGKDIKMVLYVDKNEKFSLGYLVEINDKTVICYTFEKAQFFLNHPQIFEEILKDIYAAF